MRVRDRIPYVAWGYFTAAARGEVPAVLDVRLVETWMDTRAWAQKMRAHYGARDYAYRAWRRSMAEGVIVWLQSMGAVTPANGANALKPRRGRSS